jgi:hypothetical protein
MVSAIFKKLDRQTKCNYRPISLLSCISKVFERIVFNGLYSHLKDNNILNEHNSGFKAGDSAINRLIAITDSIYKGLDQKKDVLLVFLDISKAFDRVWHEGLIHKLKTVGVCGKLLDWFSHNRTQRVVIGGQSSDTKHIQAGVPQGSILGPLLFLIYINDISDNLETPIHQFADDTTLLETVTSSTESAAKINRDLDRLYKWALQWRVTFNAIQHIL